MLQRKALIPLVVALLSAASPIAAPAGEISETEVETDGYAGASQIDQIKGNYQSTRQTGSDNMATVVQSAVAAGLLPGGNVALITQDGAGNQAGVRQQGSALEAVVGQDGNGNAGSIDQYGAGLKAGLEQFGDGRGAQIYQSGVGNGLPITVRQY